MEQAPARMNLKPCKVCGRTFNEDVLPKHTPICQKNAKKKRKVFDSGKQRAAGSDVPYNSTIKPGQAPKADPMKYQKAHEATRNNWKYKHEQFIQGMRAARGAPPLNVSGGNAPPPTMNPGMEACRYCGRTFNRDRIEKHEQICGAQAKRVQKDVGSKGRGAPAGPGRGAARPGLPTGSNKPSPASGAGSRLGPQRSPLNYSSNSPVTPADNLQTMRSTAGRGEKSNLIRNRSSSLSRNQNQRGSDNSTNPAASPATAVKVSSGPARGGVRSGSISKIPSGPARQGVNHSANNTGSNNRQSNARPPYANVPQKSAGGGGAGLAKFCGDCGTKFSGTTAKFCYECGAPRGR